MSLIKEVKNDRTEKVMELLQSSPDVNAQDNKTGNTPLHFAIENQNMTILNALLSLPKKPNLNLTNNDKVTPLSYATELNFGDAVEPLLKHGADPNFTFEGGRSALHYAAVNNARDTAKLLLKHQANVNQKCEEGTALHIAARQSNDDVGYLLIENPNADFSVTDAEGNTFLHTAIQYGAYNLFQKFFGDFENGRFASLNIKDLVNQTNAEGNTILHEAEINKRTSISQFLESNAEKFNIDVSKKNKEGFTAKGCAEQHVLKAKEEEEQKRLRREEAKEIKKQRKIENDQLEEERRAQERDLKKKERLQELKSMKQQQKQQQLRPLYGVLFILAVFVLIYFMIARGIENKKNNVMDL